MVNFFLASAQKSFFHPLGVSSYTVGVEKKPSASESRKKLLYLLLQRRSHYSYKLQVGSGSGKLRGASADCLAASRQSPATSF